MATDSYWYLQGVEISPVVQAQPCALVEPSIIIKKVPLPAVTNRVRVKLSPFFSGFYSDQNYYYEMRYLWC